jgi:hypothetical protein
MIQLALLLALALVSTPSVKPISPPRPASVAAVSGCAVPAAYQKPKQKPKPNVLPGLCMCGCMGGSTGNASHCDGMGGGGTCTPTSVKTKVKK